MVKLQLPKKFQTCFSEIVQAHCLQETPFHEFHLQQLWFEHLLPRILITTDGVRLEVIQTGWWNHEAGPDFRGAAIRLENKILHGDVELHLEGSEWQKHGHHLDPEYNSTILHIVLRGGRPVLLQNGGVVPTAELESQLKEPFFELVQHLPVLNPIKPSAKPGKCSLPLQKLDREHIRRLLREAGLYRLSLKASRLGRQRKRDGNLQTLWEWLAEALGYKENKIPFRILARRCPITSLNKLSKTQHEAWLYGTSGFLPRIQISTWPRENRAYITRLWNRWWNFQKDGAEPIPLTLWQLRQTRPVNHPQRRIAALAGLIAKMPILLESLEKKDLESFVRILASIRHAFFNFHSTFKSKPLAVSTRLIGEMRVTDMVINIGLPWLIANGHGATAYLNQLPLEQSNRQIKIASERLFNNTIFKVKSAWEQQGLLQVFQGFCMIDDSNCVQCHFPAILEKWRKTALNESGS